MDSRWLTSPRFFQCNQAHWSLFFIHSETSVWGEAPKQYVCLSVEKYVRLSVGGYVCRSVKKDVRALVNKYVCVCVFRVKIPVEVGGSVVQTLVVRCSIER